MSRKLFATSYTELKCYHKENEKGFRESISMLEVLSSNRDLKEKIQGEEKMLSMRWDELPSYEIGFEKGIEEGIEKGIEKGTIKIVSKMLPVFNDKKIHEYTGVSLSDIKKIRKENS